MNTKVSYKTFYYQVGTLQALVVAVIHEGIDWAAYIGATERDLPSQEAIEIVAKKGWKLQESIAREFFPCTEGRYRQ